MLSACFRYSHFETFRVKYAADIFISIVCKYTKPTELMQFVFLGIIEKIELFRAEKLDGVTVRRENIESMQGTRY